MSPWRTLPLLLVLVIGGCEGDHPVARGAVNSAAGQVSQQTKAVEKAQDDAADAALDIDDQIAALKGQIATLDAKKTAALARADLAEKQAVKRTVLFITLALIFGVTASTVLAIWWQSKSLGLLALAAGAAIPVVQTTPVALDHPIISGAFVIGGAVLTLAVLAAHGGWLQKVVRDAVSFGSNALAHLKRVEPEAAELVLVAGKTTQEANKTRGLIDKKIKELA